MKVTTFIQAMVSLLLVLVFAVIPLSGQVKSFFPLFPVLWMAYWALNKPAVFGLLTACLLGMMLDITTLGVTPLGQHGFALALFTGVILMFRQQILNFVLWQQALVLVPLVTLYAFVLFLLDQYHGQFVPAAWRWSPALMTAVCWPPFVGLMRAFKSARE